MRVYDMLGEAVGRLGVDTVFGLVGAGNFEVSTAMVERGGVRFYAMRHESGAVSAADGWARATRRLGVATCTQGPGFTNGLTPLIEAVKSHTPMLLVVGDTPAANPHHNQNVDQGRIAEAVGAGAHSLRSPALALADLAHAAHRAERERRPVVLSMPLDVQHATAPPSSLPTRGADLPGTVPSQGAISAVIDRLEEARRPVVLAGRGVWNADAQDPVAAVADRIGALLATSAVGHGLFSRHPYNLGIAGGFSSPLATRLLGEADLVLVFGASMNDWTTKSGELFKTASIVQCDRDEQAIGKHRPADLALVGDARLTAEGLLAELERRKVRSSGYRTPDVTEEIDSYDRAAGIGGTDPHGPLDPRSVMTALEQWLPAERTVAIDSGHFMGWPAMYLSPPDPGGFVFTQAYMSIGLGLGSAIGAAVARPDRPTVVVAGDGGLVMGLGELETVVREDLAMLVVVLDDSAYGAEVHRYGPMGMSTKLAEFRDCDFAAVAAGMGFTSATLRTPQDLQAARPLVEDVRGPVLLDCKIDASIRADWLD